jgi:hypothetical protein
VSIRGSPTLSRQLKTGSYHRAFELDDWNLTKPIAGWERLVGLLR